MLEKIMRSFWALSLMMIVPAVLPDADLVAAADLPGGTLAADPRVGAVHLPPSFDNPSFLWMLEIVIPLISLVMLIHFVRQSCRARTLSLGALLFFSTTTMFWQEWYADWGGYLLFNPKFALMPWFSDLWVGTNKPWAVIPCYGPFFTAVNLLMLRLLKDFRKNCPDRSGFVSLLLVGIPTFYFWDLINEGTGTLLGWQSYTSYYGPAIVTPKGNFPLLYPALLFVFYGVITLWQLDLRGPDGRVRFESWFGVDRLAAGWQRELARIGVWILIMNGLFLLFLTGPLVAIRLWFGHASVLAP